ncbi:hypothetical protein H1043_05995 [Thermoactinomyces vulgaris]|uniref:Uncharacterized protein n=1 Tax=Thermoactinomyces vulgaris TaxID=2026 RepID=A0ABS0QEP1_THEVU|nr:hypothetical protein [Thermoactinomyces vulgaris]MBA4551313.1 hypothetical protein [Thermoactinomyces vulgaris]MBA4595477.1 hypothetical protein [Thermoactinomyces vulgaris]MBH8587738.1 hypothetical protein [Thermoactinomyces vulgaris]
MLLIVSVGTAFWVHTLVYADGGINIPEINEDFDQFEQKDPVQKEQPVSSPPVEKKKGIVDKFTESLSKVGDWFKGKISGAWEWTKEKAAAFWDWFTKICSKMAEVVIDTLSSAWEWVKKYKEYIAFSVVLVVGVVLCLFPLTSGLGAAILWGMGISFLVSAVLNGGINKNTFLEAAIGGILGLVGGGITAGASRALTSGIGQKLVMGAKNSKVLGSVLQGGQKLVSKLPAPLQKVFGKGGFLGSVEGAGTSVTDDILHGRKINWKNAILAGVFGAGSVAVVHFAQPAINKAVQQLEPVLAKTPIVKNIFNKVDDCFAVQPTRGYHALFLATNIKCDYSGITDILKSDLKKWREEVGNDLDTIAVARTDIEGLEGEVFKGASPEVIKAAKKEAGLKSLDEEMPDRPIKAPFKSSQFKNHAEEMVINKFIARIEKLKKYANPEDVKGKFFIHQSNTTGVCAACKSGFGKSPRKGILYQFSKKYPNLEIVVSSEIKEGNKVTKKHFFIIKNGKQYEYKYNK